MGSIVSIEKNPPTVNPGGPGGRWAPLSNLTLASRAIDRAMNRAGNLPGIVCLHAPFGTGKSMAQSYCANVHNAFYVECRSHFTQKIFVQMILREMGIKPDHTVGGMMGQIANELDLSRRPLMLDDVHRIRNDSVVELIHDLHDMARATIVLAGDEQFPKRLLRISDQLHSRVLVWQKLQPATMGDARKLADFYCTAHIADDLLAHVLKRSTANARILSINIDHIREHCEKHGLKKIDLEGWGKLPLNGDTEGGAK